MSWIFPALISTLTSTLVFTALYVYLYWQEREPCLKAWSWGWALFAGHIASLIGIVSWQPHLLLVLVHYLATLWSCVALLWGTLSYRRRRLPWWWPGGGVLVSLWVVGSHLAGVDFFWFTLPQYLFTGLVLGYTGLLWLGSRQTPAVTRWAAGMSFLLYGLHKLDYPFLRPIPEIAPWGYLLAELLTTLAAVTIPLAFLQRAKSQAEAERQRLQQVADGLPVQISHLDRDLRYLFVNRAYRRYQGLDHDQEILGRTMPEVLGAEVFSGLEKHIRRALAGQAVEFEDVRTLPDGRKRYLRVRYIPARDAQGRVGGLYGLLEDITARRRAELAQRSSEHKFATAFNTAPVSLVISTRDRGVILEVNDTFCRTTGYRREEVVGRTSGQLGLWRDPGERRRILRLLRKRGQVENLPLTLVDREGREHHCLISCHSLDYQDQPCMLSLVVDITERVLVEQEKGDLEQQLRQARHMEAVGTLAGGIAHDFNNILAAIMGYGELVLDELPSSGPARENQQKMLRAAQRARKLVEQILTFSRLGSTGGRQAVRVAQVLEEALALLETSLPSSVELELDLEARRSVVMADPTHLHQVVMNLCVNAAQAMEPEGGRLSVSLREEELSHHASLPPGRYLCLEVRDTGQGMEQQDLSRIFEPYFTTKEVGRGTGLGLSVVHGIVQELGGAIKVDSTPGRGSCFRVYLPLYRERAAGEEEMGNTPPEQTSLPCGEGESILLVDDEEDVADMCRQALERLGYRVRTFHNSPEALAAFQADPGAFDLVITDQTMPQLTGPALARQITRLRPDIPVIMYTGYNPDPAPPPEAGIREVLAKPLGLHSLAWAVRRVLDRA